MNNNVKLASLMALFSIIGISQVSAQQNRNREQQGPPSFDVLLEKMDTNEDGKLSEAEVKGPLKKDFTKVDLNEDGYITEEEFKKAPKPKRPPKRQ
ncbi:EF-hand domain-containing protein [Flagellimonas flava]|uniref:EF-hand domain pair n=1 Tax=Flagellimonas flava TaxID=570519 RepID=A0A1M5N866_9FLAO|nr:EF-hand domain-containing protein [Allomuricauda flava]SHG85655.1 EF-hand domain pair [Allomuricauda flava]